LADYLGSQRHLAAALGVDPAKITLELDSTGEMRPDQPSVTVASVDLGSITVTYSAFGDGQLGRPILRQS